MTLFMNIADLIDPDDADGRSYRDVNASRSHLIPLGALVEIEGGARLYVVMHGRDCDQTPLYWLSHDASDTVQRDPIFRNASWIGGYSEGGLTVIKDR